MRRLTLVVILVALNWIAIPAQQKDQPSSIPTTPVSVSPLLADTPPNLASLRRSIPDFNFGQPQTRNPTVRAADPLTNGESPFVFVGGALYMRVLGGDFLAPVPGGGASGCFSVDLPRRIKILDEFAPKLTSLPRN